MKKKRTAKQWVDEKYYGKLTIVNPFGWKKAKVSLNAEITEDEFEAYLAESSVTGMLEAKNEIKFHEDKKAKHVPSPPEPADRNKPDHHNVIPKVDNK